MKVYKEQSDKVAAYYNKWNEKYKQVYGTNIQAHRPPSDQDLMEYTIKSAGLADGQKILFVIPWNIRVLFYNYDNCDN